MDNGTDMNTTLDPIELARGTEIANVGATTSSFGIAPTVYYPLVVEPENVEEVSRLLAWANERGLKVVPQGSGTKQDRGASPSGCDILLDLRRIEGIIEHAAGDMTCTVRAGTLLSDLQGEL